MRRSLLSLAAVAAIVIAMDRWTKHWASVALPYNQPIQIAGDYLRLTYTRNSGVAFGIGHGSGFPYYVFSIIAIVAILWMFASGRAGHSVPRRVALALILGGAIGNLVDRLSRGEVVDFIEMGIPRWHWPVFNVADAAITVGVLLFAFTWPRERPGAEAVPGAAEVPPPGDGDEQARPEGPGLERGAASRRLPGDGAEKPLP